MTEYFGYIILALLIVAVMLFIKNEFDDYKS